MIKAYCLKTKEKNVPMQDAVVTKTAKGGYIANGHDGKGNKMAAIMSEAKALQAFAECAHYDISIADYFNKGNNESEFRLSIGGRYDLRYGENPHQAAAFYGDVNQMFDKLNGKELS